MIIKNPSPEQAAFLRAMRESDRNILVSAAAGSGKTTTIIAAMHELPAGTAGHYIVFAKRNQLEAAERLQNSPVNAVTLNALGGRALRAGNPKLRFGSVKVRKVWDAINKTLDRRTAKECGGAIKKMVDLARDFGIGVRGIDDYDPETWGHIFAEFDIPTGKGDRAMGPSDLIPLAVKVLREVRRMSERGIIDFNDQCYAVFHMPALWPECDIVFVDESQDLNRVQRWMVADMIGLGGPSPARAVFVGDRWQSVFGFRGADSESMDRIREEFDCVEMPLSVCWRCDTAMIERAQSFGAPIQAAPGKAEGRIVAAERYETEEGDTVLCRTNAPLVSAAYRLIAQGKRATVLGRDIGAGLTSLIKKLRPNSLDDLGGKVCDWLVSEIETAEGLKSSSKRESAEDKAACIHALTSSLPPRSSVDDLISAIEALFGAEADDRGVTFSSVHKAKGMEWDRVILLDPGSMPLKWAKTENAKRQELNIMYVAYTRARHEIIEVSSQGLNAREGDQGLGDLI